MNVTALTLACVTALVAAAVAGALRGYAQRRLLDMPNARSSHTLPTPRGGGVGIVIAHCAAMIAAELLGDVPPGLLYALLGGGLLVAAVGFIDDHGHVPAMPRIATHFLAFGWAVWWLGGLPAVDFGRGPWDLGVVGTVALVTYLVWYLNLFNFMDGIDGIAGAQAVTMCLSAVALVAAGSGEIAQALPLAWLAAAAAGFLWWNWPPARIFMGDVGSGYLGYALGTLALATVVAGLLNVWVWLILGGAFLADATVTLVRRALRVERLAVAHRSHAYQRLSRRWRSHRAVTLLFVAINLGWLAPWAYAACRWPHLGLGITALALAPLAMAAWLLGAGEEESPRSV